MSAEYTKRDWMMYFKGMGHGFAFAGMKNQMNKYLRISAIYMDLYITDLQIERSKKEHKKFMRKYIKHMKS